MRRLFTSLLALGLFGMTGCYHLAGVCDCEPERCNCPPWSAGCEGGPTTVLPMPPPPALPSAPAPAVNSDKGA